METRRRHVEDVFDFDVPSRRLLRKHQEWLEVKGKP
jgi:hypothetical protein